MNPDDLPLLDRELLLRRLGGAEEVVAQVYNDIAGSFPLRLEECRRALEEGDMEALREAAHTIKGSAATAGAERAACRASILRTLAQDESVGRAGLLEALEELASCVARTLEEAQA